MSHSSGPRLRGGTGSHIELGIELVFWRNELAAVTDEAPAILPFAIPG